MYTTAAVTSRPEKNYTLELEKQVLVFQLRKNRKYFVGVKRYFRFGSFEL